MTEQCVRSPLAAVKHKQSGPVDNNESLAAPARRSLQSTYVGLGVGSTEAIQSKIDRKESTSTDSGFEDAVDFPTPHSYDDLSATVRQLCDMVESDGKTVGALRFVKSPATDAAVCVSLLSMPLTSKPFLRDAESHCVYAHIPATLVGVRLVVRNASAV